MEDKTLTRAKPAAPATYRPSEELLDAFLRIARQGQRAVVSVPAGDEDFKANGLRKYALYRELGVAAATGGLVQAHVIRMLPPCPPEANAAHFHATVFQIIYVLKGWSKVQLEGHEPIVMTAGTCWTQPPSIRHAVLDYSDDFEVLEILLPADFETVNV